MPIQVIAPASNRAAEQLAAIDMIGRSIGQFGQQFKAQQDEQAQRQALVELLGGRAAETPTAAQLDPTQIAPGSQAGTLAAPATPGLMPGMDRAQAEQLVAAGLGPEVAQVGLERRFPEPTTPEPPKTRNILVGDERVFQQFNTATGQWEEVGRGPAFAPPAPAAQITNISGQAADVAAQTPGALRDLEQISPLMFNPDGSVNTELLATVNIPGANVAVPFTRGADIRATLDSAIETIIGIRGGDRRALYDTYMPSTTDTAEGVRNKMQRLQRDLSAALGVATQGRGGIPTGTGGGGPSREAGTVEQIIGQGLNLLGIGEEPATAEPEVTSEPAPLTMDQVNAMTADQVNRQIERMSDEQLRQLPAGLRQFMLDKIEGRR